LVVDASVAVKWLVDDSQAAQLLLDSNEKLIAPGFVLIEVGNVLWKKARRLEIKVELALAGIPALPTYFEQLVPSESLLPRALAIAIEIGHAVLRLPLPCLRRATRGDARNSGCPIRREGAGEGSIGANHCAN
jgi:hypothetical protein